MKEVIVNINKQGNSTVSVNGVKGSECKDLTRVLEAELGAVSETKPTSEMYETEHERVDGIHQQG